MSRRITPHFTLAEVACHDGTPYPAAWIADRLVPLCEIAEVIRREAGGQPVLVSSGYRTPAYNRQIGGARASQHIEGRALDLRRPGWSAARFHALILHLHREGMLTLGGLGLYPTFVHIDTRPGGRLARWGGSRTET